MEDNGHKISKAIVRSFNGVISSWRNFGCGKRNYRCIKDRSVRMWAIVHATVKS